MSKQPENMYKQTNKYINKSRKTRLKLTYHKEYEEDNNSDQRHIPYKPPSRKANTVRFP